MIFGEKEEKYFFCSPFTKQRAEKNPTRKKAKEAEVADVFFFVYFANHTEKHQQIQATNGVFFVYKIDEKIIIRIFYKPNIQKRQKTGINSPSKYNYFHILPYIEKNHYFSRQNQL